MRDDRIGASYANLRQPDPRIIVLIDTVTMCLHVQGVTKGLADGLLTASWCRLGLSLGAHLCAAMSSFWSPGEETDTGGAAQRRTRTAAPRPRPMDT